MFTKSGCAETVVAGGGPEDATVLHASLEVAGFAFVPAPICEDGKVGLVHADPVALGEVPPMTAVPMWPPVVMVQGPAPAPPVVVLTLVTSTVPGGSDEFGNVDGNVVVVEVGGPTG